ncbi:MAG: hypothetical protein H0W12_09205, partial [Chitinophagaceae bacterium]|nr:hypothetical protein [Chitinophagaceae bacterium]
MKIEQVIIHHLYNNKEVTLQRIGTFRFNSTVQVPADTDKEIVIPDNAISFEYNPKALQDPGLIDSIVQNTLKIKPLAIADLDSFITLGKEYINIGKPFRIEGLGTLDKTQNGELEFTAGQFITPKIEAPKALKENEMEESSGLFNDYNTVPNNNGKKTAVILGIIVLIGLVSWALWNFVFKKKTGDENVTQTEQEAVDTSTQKKDSTTSTLIKTDSSQLNTVPGKDYTFRIVFKQTNNKLAAENSMVKLNSGGHKVIMYTDDSIHYKLAELFTLPLTDT